MMGKRNAYAMAARQRKAGPHSGCRKPDVFDNIERYEEKELTELAARWQEEREQFEVGERIQVVAGRQPRGEARIVSKLVHKEAASYGIVYDWDMNMTVVYVTGKDIERL